MNVHYCEEQVREYAYEGYVTRWAVTATFQGEEFRAVHKRRRKARALAGDAVIERAKFAEHFDRLHKPKDQSLNVYLDALRKRASEDGLRNVEMFEAQRLEIEALRKRLDNQNTEQVNKITSVLTQALKDEVENKIPKWFLKYESQAIGPLHERVQAVEKQQRKGKK